MVFVNIASAICFIKCVIIIIIIVDDIDKYLAGLTTTA